MVDKSLEGKCYVTQCPSCKRWQSKSARNFGKDISNAECISCRKKFDVKMNGRLFDCRDAPNIVAQRNAPDGTAPIFRRAVIKRG